MTGVVSSTTGVICGGANTPSIDKGAYPKAGANWATVDLMVAPLATQSLQLKVLLRDVHPAVWRRVTLSDALSIADLHQVIQLVLGWDDDHLHRFCIQGREYGIAYADRLHFDEDAAAVPLSRFQFRPSERFLYEYDFTAGWQIEIRVEKATQSGSCPKPPFCIAGQEPSPPDGCGGPQCYAEQRREAFSGGMADDMDTVVAVLRRVSERDPTVLDDPDELWDFERAVSRLEARRPFLSDRFERSVVNAALRQAFAAAGSSP